MDSTLALALMMKAKLVFENEDTFLSFPREPALFETAQLTFSGGAPTASDRARLAHFSALVNAIPDGGSWPPPRPTMLWDAYRRILREAVLATSWRTDEEEARYQSALDELTVTNPDGTRTSSAAAIRYERARDAVFAARQTHRNAVVAANATGDAALRARWAAREPALRAAVERAEAEWETRGHRAQVDAARRTVRWLGAKSPLFEWARLTSGCNPGIDALPDEDGTLFFPTGFAPANVLNAPLWESFTLGGDEAAALIRRAPNDLRTYLAPDPVDVAIDRLSFGYRAVALNRAWFDPSFFEQHYWRFGDSAQRVSDGRSLAGGLCPAYVTGCIFARDIKLRLASGAADAIADRLTSGRRLNLGMFAFDGVGAGRAATIARDASPAPEPAYRRTTIHESPAPLASRALLSIRQAQHDDHAPPRARDTTADGIHIVAFICKRVPASPNPDRALVW